MSGAPAPSVTARRPLPRCSASFLASDALMTSQPGEMSTTFAASKRLRPRSRHVRPLPRCSASFLASDALMTPKNTNQDGGISAAKNRGEPRVVKMEPVIGIEPMASSLPRKCSTPELHRRWWARMDSNHGRQSQRIYSPPRLTATARAHRVMKLAMCAFQVARCARRHTPAAQRSKIVPREKHAVNEKDAIPRTRAYLHA